MPSKPTENFIHFKDPFEMLVYYDPKLRNGEQKLYDWQVRKLREFAAPVLNGEPRQSALVANNGSGKSQYILAPCAVWLAIIFDQSLGYVTSSSASQLDTQTERYINFLIERMEILHADAFKSQGLELWKNIKRQKTFHPTASFIDLFATDEPKRAEGKHPLSPGAEFAVFVDEGKSIVKEIYDAIDRCTGATRRLDISSPGTCHGHFYDIITKPELGWLVDKVTVYDCPHIGKKEVDRNIVKHGINDPLIRSMYFAEFTDVDAQVVITRHVIDQCSKHGAAPWLWIDEHNGLDLSAGGDEIVLSMWQGFKFIGQEIGVWRDTTQARKEIIHWIQKHKLSPDRIWADDGGVGRGIIDQLAEAGYKVNRVLNQWKARDFTRYLNRGTEMWFEFKRFVEECQLDFSECKDRTLFNQLCNRYYKRNETNQKLMLEPKAEAKRKGHPSPDRADAAALAWSDYSFPLIQEGEKPPAKGSDLALDELMDVVRHGDLSSIVSGAEDIEERYKSIFPRQNDIVKALVGGGSSMVKNRRLGRYRLN